MSSKIIFKEDDIIYYLPCFILMISKKKYNKKSIVIKTKGERYKAAMRLGWF